MIDITFDDYSYSVAKTHSAAHRSLDSVAFSIAGLDSALQLSGSEMKQYLKVLTVWECSNS